MEARMPKMLSANQIEAHVTRLTAVREGLRKYEGDDGRAKEAGGIIEAAIATLQQEVPVPQKAAEDAAAPIEEVAEDEGASSLKDEAVEAAAIGEEEAEPTNHSDPSNLPPPTPIRSGDDQKDVRQNRETGEAKEDEEVDPTSPSAPPRW